MEERHNMTKNKKNPGKYLQNGKKAVSLHRNSANGGLAQLARALAWHARGHRFESDILHKRVMQKHRSFFVFSAFHHTFIYIIYAHSHHCMKKRNLNSKKKCIFVPKN